MGISEWVQVAAVVVMVTGVLAILAERWRSGRGIGVRVIQLMAVLLVIPSILVLALQEFLSSESVGTLLGATVGYILSGIGKDEPRS